MEEPLGAQEPPVRPAQMPMPPLALSPTSPAADLGNQQPGSPDPL